jgi:hypothetical protein
MTTREILTTARSLIAKQWIKRLLATNAGGVAVRPDSDSACAWCTIGAVCASSREVLDRDEAYRSLRGVLSLPHRMGLAEWNDAPERTQADVLDAFDHAIAACEVSS